MSDAGSDGDRDRRGVLGTLRWAATTDEGGVAYARDIITSVGAVLGIGLVLFAVSDIWPPLVAIESASMEPNLMTGDLVFVMEEHRFAPGDAHAGTGVVTHQVAREGTYRKFNQPGDVVVYAPDGNRQTTPIIHRARLWVEEGENWYDEANPNYLGDASNCQELTNCPAPHAGFITKGDSSRNRQYDQVGPSPISSPVKPEWIIGTAEFRIPWLGNIRLWFSQLATGPASVAAPAAPAASAGTGAPA